MPSTPQFAARELEHFRKGGADFCRELARKAGGSASSRRDLGALVERLRNLVLSDRVAFYLTVSASLKKGCLELTGESEREEFPHIFAEVFRHLGFTRIINRMEILPDLTVNPDPFGLVAVPHLLTYSQPDFGGIGMDEALLGEPVYVFKELPAACLVKTFSGYWGYAAKSGITRVPKGVFIRHLNAPKVCLQRDCKAGATWIPAGACLSLRHWGAGPQCCVVAPTGEILRLPKKFCRRNERRKDMARLLAYARSYLESPYNMGGKNSRTGIDCSGLVQMSYRAFGINLPRDAKQQYLGGHLIHPCAAEAMQPGDAMFFVGDNGQVDHTALYVGNGQAIHATGKQVVKIQSLDPASPNHLKRYPRDFIGAKRFWW